MHFIIDSDSGNSIKGWLAPDNPSLTPTIIIIIPGRNEIAVQANVTRAGIRDLGLHSTGLVGFDVNTKIVPDLDQIDDIEIVEAETRLPIYRRLQKGRHIERKMFLFDCSIMPQRRILSAIEKHFTLTYSNSERNGLETTINIISNPFNSSIFISGRSLLSRYDQYLKNKGYVRVALLREPFEELAERLLFLNFLAKEGASSYLETYSTGVTTLIDFARELPLNDPRGLTTAFRATSDQQRRELMSPMTKVFGCDLDEVPKRVHVSKALDNLATIDVVGTRERYGLFKELLSGVLGVDVLGEEGPTSFRTVKGLATTLSRIGLVADLLEEDLALYAYVDEAITEGISHHGGEIRRDVASR